jgi:AraC-like DNA-binding protein
MDDDLIFLHGSATPRCNTRVDKHFDGYYTMQYMDRGAIDLSHDDRAWRLEGAWCWTAFPGPRIRFAPAVGTGNWSHRYVAFRGARVGRWIADRLYHREPQAAPDGTTPLFDALLEQSTRGGKWGTLRATNLLEQLLLRLAEARQQPASREPWLETLLARLDRAGEFVPDYEALAGEAGLSLSTLRRKFRAATGTPLHGYVQQCRLAKARHLLGETDWPIKQIAERLGYQDVYFFSRQFRALSGVPPAAFRKSRQG